MPLAHGRRFGPYEILDLIGSGGMGEVYRARDTRLDRTVAIKVLTVAASNRPKARERFERERRAISSLSHPHICAVYDVGHEDGIDYIVMEYLEGEPLSRRLAGSLRLEHALRYAVEIASALAAAHRAGIVHRDLKPGNVMLTASGAKLLDFGLAKLLHDPSSDATADAITVEGQMVGTLAYMSPEQVEGRAADARSDVFSFGTMLHEMLTHQRAFDGSSAHVIAAILSSQPPAPSTIQTLCPPEVDHLVARCLAKDADERWQDARDLHLELKWAAARVPAAKTLGRRSLRPLAWALAAALVGALVVGAVLRLSGEDPLPNASPRQVTMAPGWESDPALSPDGGLIAYASDESGNTDIWIVDVRGGTAIRLTDDPASDTHPAWYPDGSALAFTSDRGGGSAIWKVLRFGGAPSLLVPDAVDAALSPDGSQIAFARSSTAGTFRIWIAPLADPSQARVLTGDGDGFWDHRDPAFSPDGRTLCYHAERDLWLVPVQGQGARRLTTDDERDIEPVWSPDGRYVYFSSLRGGAYALWRVPAGGGGGRARRATAGTGGERHPSLSHDGRRLAFATFSANPDLTLLDLTTGTEARLRGLSTGSPEWTPDGRSLVFSSVRIGGRYDLWAQSIVGMDAVGPPRRLTDHPGSVSSPAVSPDGRWVAYYRVLSGQRDIWIVPMAGGNPIQFTDDKAADFHPAWSPDGTQLAFGSDRGGSPRIWVAPVADGRPAGPARPVTTGATSDQAPAWSPDGSWIAYLGAASDRSADIWVVDAAGAGPARMQATEGRARRVAWDRGAKALFVSGQWDPWVSLRKYALETGKQILLDRPIRLGQNPDLIEFTISRDGRIVAFTKDESRGDVWALESLDRPY
jgi:Tol biopolymer transport system component/predicted Ser/Thr protein kinase